MACFCLIYIYIPYSWWNYIYTLFFFWYICLWIPACLELAFLFLKKRSFAYRFFLFSLLRNHQILEQLKTIILWKNNMRAHRMKFAAFSRAIINWWEKPCASHLVKYTIRRESDERKVPIRWGKKWYQFPKLFQFDGFDYISSCCGELMGKPMYFTCYKVYHRMLI